MGACCKSCEEGKGCESKSGCGSCGPGKGPCKCSKGSKASAMGWLVKDVEAAVNRDADAPWKTPDDLYRWDTLPEYYFEGKKELFFDLERGQFYADKNEDQTPEAQSMGACGVTMGRWEPQGRWRKPADRWSPQGRWRPGQRWNGFVSLGRDDMGQDVWIIDPSGRRYRPWEVSPGQEGPPPLPSAKAEPSGPTPAKERIKREKRRRERRAQQQSYSPAPGVTMVPAGVNPLTYDPYGAAYAYSYDASPYNFYGWPVYGGGWGGSVFMYGDAGGDLYSRVQAKNLLGPSTMGEEACPYGYYSDPAWGGECMPDANADMYPYPVMPTGPGAYSPAPYGYSPYPPMPTSPAQYAPQDLYSGRSYPYQRQVVVQPPPARYNYPGAQPYPSMPTAPAQYAPQTNYASQPYPAMPTSPAQYAPSPAPRGATPPPAPAPRPSSAPTASASPSGGPYKCNYPMVPGQVCDPNNPCMSTFYHALSARRYSVCCDVNYDAAKARYVAKCGNKRVQK